MCKTNRPQIKLLLITLVFTFQVSLSFSQNSKDADAILKSVHTKLSSLKVLRYNQIRELNYASEDYKNISEWTCYYDFTNNNSVLGFNFQTENESSKQVYNGTESFALNKAEMSIEITEKPSREDLEPLSTFYNSIITLRNILPKIIEDQKIEKSVSDTTINGKAVIVVTVNLGKRRIQNLGLDFDAMQTKSDFIYTFLIDKNSYLPIEIIQSNNLNSDFIKTSFTNINTQPKPPSEDSWFYSTYTNEYKPSSPVALPKEISIGMSAPNFILEALGNNKNITLSDLKGQVVLLDFWIKNCGPCIQSVPHLNTLQKKFKDKEFKILSINAYDTDEEITQFSKKHKIDYSILINGKEIAIKYGVNAYPTFFLIDKTGNVVFTQTGYSTTSNTKIESVITNALK